LVGAQRRKVDAGDGGGKGRKRGSKDAHRLLLGPRLILGCGGIVVFLRSLSTVYTPYLSFISASLPATMRARSTTTLACFQVASSCILPSIMTAPVPSGIAARIFFANATSFASGENTRLAIAI